MSLLPLDEAQARLLAMADPVAAESLPVERCVGRWLAEDVLARRTQPASDLSAMDGYALRYEDLSGTLTVVGESAAGASYDGALAPGQAVRIFTGAPLPEGADTVLVQEEAARDGERLRLDGDGPSGAGAHVRKSGRDFAEGDKLASAGDRLTAPALAMAIAGGHGALAVRRRIRVAAISTGDELVPPGAPTSPAQIPASNGAMLAAQLATLPVDFADGGIVADDLETLGAAIDAARDADILVTIGGASVGDHDLVRPALENAGAAIDFWKVAVKPGKPIMAGRLGAALVLGLPGNPASAFVTAKLFLEPLIAALSGAADPLPHHRQAVLGTDLPPGGERTEYLRARWSSGRIEPLAQQSSAALDALAQAQALIRRESGAPAAAEGEVADILPLA